MKASDFQNERGFSGMQCCGVVIFVCHVFMIGTAVSTFAIEIGTLVFENVYRTWGLQSWVDHIYRVALIIGLVVSARIAKRAALTLLD